jgi:hypothetical protein
VNIDIDIVADIQKIGMIRTSGRMDHGRIVKKIFESKKVRRRRMEKPKWKWLEDVEKYLWEMEVKRW